VAPRPANSYSGIAASTPLTPRLHPAPVLTRLNIVATSGFNGGRYMAHSSRFQLIVWTFTPRRFAFVEMSTDAEGNRAMAELSGREIHRHKMTVTQARPEIIDGLGRE
jgi:hypothetical protein